MLPLFVSLSCVRAPKSIFVHGFQVPRYFLTMPPNKSKRSASEDSTSDSGPDDRNPPPKKSKPTDKESSKKPSTKSSSNEEHSWTLDRNRMVKVREFRGKLFVDIREYYEKNGETLPGKKGISLSMGQWNKLKEYIDDIQESVEKLG